jgi:hypothetical protein
MAVAVAAGSHREAEIYRNPDMAIGAAATYALTSTLLGARPEELDPRVCTALLHRRISSAIAATLAAKGYRQDSAVIADILVHFRVGVRTAERNLTGLVRRLNSAKSSSTFLTVTPAGTREMTEGTLVIELAERQTGAVVYRVQAQDDDVRLGTRQSSRSSALSESSGRSLDAGSRPCCSGKRVRRKLPGRFF